MWRESSSMNEYLQNIDRSIRTGNGEYLAELISLRSEYISYIPTKVDIFEDTVQQSLSQPIADIVLPHLMCIKSLREKNFMEAYNYQSSCVNAVAKFLQLQKEEVWSLPLMYTVCLELRLIAQQAEKHAVGPQHTPGSILERVAECLMTCFRVCAADFRGSETDTKRVGMLNLVNQLLKVYFQINKLHLCKPLIRAIDSSPYDKNFTSLSQQITYKYFVGRKAIFDSDYKSADLYLSFAFQKCHKNSIKNKRQILLYLVPVKMLLGFMPIKRVLEKYDLLQLWDLVEAVKRGNLKQIDAVMEKHESFFIKAGIYIIVEKLKILAYRNLFRKVYLIENTHQIPVSSLQAALEAMGQTDIDLDETQCIVANLIYDGKIKGYISYKHRMVVVSKQNPFPSISTLA